MPLPPVSTDIILRLRAIDIAYTASRLEVIKRQSGIGPGIRVEHREPLAAFLAPDIPTDSFNRIVGVRADALDWIDDLHEDFRRRGQPCTLIVFPGDLDTPLADRLAERGFRHTVFHSALYGPVAAESPHDDRVDVRQVDDPQSLELFLTSYLRGRGLPEPAHERAKVNMRGWLGEPGWRLYLATLGGAPAAAGILFVHGQDAYLADAATDPEFRGRGCQRALIARRIADAHAAGCGLVFGQTPFSGSSQRNMERGGLQMLCTPAVWTDTAS